MVSWGGSVVRLLMEWSWTRSPPGCLWVTPHGRGAFDAAISIDAAHIKQQLRAELGPAAIAKRLGIARSSVYRALA